MRKQSHSANCANLGPIAVFLEAPFPAAARITKSPTFGSRASADNVSTVVYLQWFHLFTCPRETHSANDEDAPMTPCIFRLCPMLPLLVMVAVVLAGCASPKKDFEAAAGINTSAAWEGYLAKHGESLYATEAQQRLDLIRQHERYAQQIDLIVSQAESSGKSVRDQVRYLKQERDRFPDTSFYDEYTEKMGLGYLQHVVFAREALALVADEIIESKDMLLVNLDTHGLYGSIAYPGEPLTPISDGYRGFLTHPSIKTRPGEIKAKGAVGRELYGKLDFYLKKTGLSHSDLLTSSASASLPSKYRTSNLEATYQQPSGALVNMYDVAAGWAKQNPEAATALGLLATAAMINNSSR